VSLELIVDILQVGFSGFVFLMALFSYKLIRREQDRDGAPREKILNQLSSFRLWAFLVALLVLLSPILESFVTTKLDVKSVPDISWKYKVDGNSKNIFQCIADEVNVGTPVDCTSYNSCGKERRNTTVCRGLFYKEAIENRTN